VGGERPHVTVTVSAEALRDLEGSAELDHAGPVPVEVARRIACDASIVRAVMAGPSEPLDLGRRTPLVSAAQRRAVILRDRHCRFPGCDRPPAWDDVHHIVHWPDGGRTDLCNLILLCRRHHRLCHARGGFGLAVEDGRPVFRRPDGSVLEDRMERAPPLAV
jgi:5-methylcytosine-specific restriction protein A